MFGEMEMPAGLVLLAAATLALSACAGSHRLTSGSGPGPVLTKLPAPVAKRIAAQGRDLAKSLGDPAVKTAQVYGPDSRYVLVKASSGDLVEKLARERRGFYLIVLRGRFVCNSCTGPAGAAPPKGTIATNVWSPTRGGTDFGLSRGLPAAVSGLPGPTVVELH
jgi:hypothetical protein